MVTALIIIGLIFLGVILKYNKLIKLKNNVDASKSCIDVYLQQRFDLIPNLVEITKGYIKYEVMILKRISELRTMYNESKSMNVSNLLNYYYNSIMLYTEEYPELKAEEQFLNLQKVLIKIESQLQAARRAYNNDVTKYNTNISTFPNSIVADMFNFKPTELFELEGKKENIEVKI